MDIIFGRHGNVSRRDFIKTSASAALSLTALTTVTTGLYAAGPEKFRVALIGCGGRGKGALQNCLDAAKEMNVPMEVVALADAMPDRVMEAAEKFNVSPDRCFVGFSAYKKVLASEADLVLLVTPPIFRPLHLEAAIAAGKHVFMEKPVAVDPPGTRRIIAAGEKAKEKGLAIVAGTQRRHSADYRKTQYAVEHGAIGELRGGTVLWCGGQLWYKERQPTWSDAEYLVRNWVSFLEMSGDHIVEQHIHNIDIANWFVGHPPEMALGFGGRARRKTGNQFDFFSIDFDYGDGVHIHSACRQVHGCYSRVGEFFRGADGECSGNKITKAAKEIKTPDFPGENQMVQEHIDLLKSIVAGEPLNDATRIAETTLTAIMGRISAYTGQIVRWSDLTREGSTYYDLMLKPTPEDFETGGVFVPEEVPPIPGEEKK